MSRLATHAVILAVGIGGTVGLSALPLGRTASDPGVASVFSGIPSELDRLNGIDAQLAQANQGIASVTTDPRSLQVLSRAISILLAAEDSSKRLREDARARLVKDGKISASAELLGWNTRAQGWGVAPVRS